MADSRELAFETKVIHAGVEPDPLTGAVMTPIYQTSTYAQSAPGEHKGYEYSRSDNPTRTVLQTQLAELENADKALTYASGLASTDAVLNLLKSGDHVVAGDDLYGGTRRLFTRVAAHRGLEFTFVPIQDICKVQEAIQPNTRLIWFETPTNPLLNVADIRAIARLGKESNVLTAVDNTFMTPYFQRPIELGIDIVMHSMTKYLNGHSDVVMGALMFKDRQLPFPAAEPGHETLYARLKFLQNAVGSTPGPFECFLVLRGLKTLAIRMERHGQNAMKVAQWLEKHPSVERVVYPGLVSHPGHETMKRQASGFGGMLTFFIKGGLEAARTFLSEVKLFTLAESLGGVESLIEHPAIMTHASVPPEVRAQIGLADNLIRVSAGIESVDDLIADMDRAFQAI